MARKLRTRKHKVVLNRSAGGDAGITFMLVVLGAFMFLPMVYAISQSLKPLDELFMFPPKFLVTKPTLDNYADLFMLMNTSWVPFSRYILGDHRSRILYYPRTLPDEAVHGYKRYRCGT